MNAMYTLHYQPIQQVLQIEIREWYCKV